MDGVPCSQSISPWLLAIVSLLASTEIQCKAAAQHKANPANADNGSAFESPVDLWRGFDPTTLPLEVAPIRTWREGNLEIENLRFTGEVAKQRSVRVYAIQGAPSGASALPGILHVHGGGQTASLDWVRFWASRGYVCVSFDFCGKVAGREFVTDWGPIPQGDMMENRGISRSAPSHDSPWYHWALVSRRALTLLERHPRVDPKRLGVFGISIGGSLTWMIAGSDARVKAAAPIYGCGYNYDRRNVVWGLPAPSLEQLHFQRILSPEAHAPYISCPLLYLSATNDFHGLMDRAHESLESTTGTTWQAFTPRTNHHIDPRQGRSLPLWFDWQLKGIAAFPKSPQLSVRLRNDGVPTAIVEPSELTDVADVEVFYALGSKRPQARFWRGTETKINGNLWEAALPVMDTWDELRAFANITYRSGVCVSSPIRLAIPAQLGKARATLKWSPTPTTGKYGSDFWFFTTGYTDPVADWPMLEYGRESSVGPFVGFNAKHMGDPVAIRLATHILGDPQFHGRDGDALSFQFRGGITSTGLSVTLTENDWGTPSRKYVAKIDAADLAPGWRRVALPRSRFLDEKRRPLGAWRVIDKLEIEGRAARKDPPRFADLRWVELKQP